MTGPGRGAAGAADPEALPAALIARAARGDAEAFAVIVAALERSAWGLAYRMCGDGHLAADVAQEIFLNLYRNFGRYDTARPFTPWFMTLATNTAIKTLKLMRHRHRRVFSELAEPGTPGPQESVAAPDAEAGALTEDSERHARLRALIAGLPEKYAAILALRSLEERSIEDIAQLLGMPEGTVKVRLFRARDLLRRRLEAEGLL